MKRPSRSTIAAGLLAAIGMAACGTAIHQSSPAGVQSGASQHTQLTPAQQAAADKGIEPYTAADVHFLQGMIGHHAQAVLMADWAPSHGASAAVRGLCERIAVAQTDEITFMSRWLRERHLDVPRSDTAYAHSMPGMAGMAGMPGMDHPMLMPGMLNAAQLAQLNSAKGPEFDRLFLEFMIMHHQGAITMVNDLFGAYGAAQDNAIYKFATDVNADQTAEIDRMSRMLASM